MESSSTPISIASGIVVDDKSDLCPNVMVCQICMEPPTDPVATSCGHVFCWPCMHQWLRSEPKPCPICRTQLQRNRNILPLYGAGSGTGPNNSNGGVADAAALDSVIPARPPNPHSFNKLAMASLEVSGHAMGAARQLVRDLLIERGDLELKVTDLEQRNSDLRQEAMESDHRHFEETNRMGEEIANLQLQLALANHLLASGGRNGV